MQLIDDHVPQPAEDPLNPVAVPDEHRLQRLGCDQQEAGRCAQHPRLAAGRSVTVPTVYRHVQWLAEFDDPAVLVVDQCLERADEERLQAGGADLSMVGEHRADRQQGRLGLAACGGRREDHVPVTVDDEPRGAFLDVTQPVPATFVYPALDIRVVQLVRLGRRRSGRLRAGTR